MKPILIPIQEPSIAFTFFLHAVWVGLRHQTSPRLHGWLGNCRVERGESPPEAFLRRLEGRVRDRPTSGPSPRGAPPKATSGT